MVELFNNTKNKEMVFNVSAEGIDPAKVEVRMLLVNEGKSTSLLFMGDIENGKVRFELPALVELSEAQQGTMRLEVIADGEYFKPWESEFQVKTKATFTVTSPVTESVEAPKKMQVELEASEEPVAPKKTVVVVNDLTPEPEAPKLTPAAVKEAAAKEAPAPKPAAVVEKVAVKKAAPVVAAKAPKVETDNQHIPVSFEDFLKNNQ